MNKTLIKIIFWTIIAVVAFSVKYSDPVNRTTKDYIITAVLLSCAALYGVLKALLRQGKLDKYFRAVSDYLGVDEEKVMRDYKKNKYNNNIKWAEKGYAKYQFDLGLCYANGEGVAKDFIQAVVWYRKAAEQDHAGAQYCLGLCYYFGDGVIKDYELAVYWYQKAATQGVARAQYYLGRCFANGDGVTKDQEQADYWYSKAAKQGVVSVPE